MSKVTIGVGKYCGGIGFWRLVPVTVAELRRVRRIEPDVVLYPETGGPSEPLNDDEVVYISEGDAEEWGMRQVDQSLNDAPFDPEAEGWEPRKTGTGGGTYYDEPRPGCLTFVTIPSTGLTALLDLSDGITLYHGKHPTRSLVMAIIEQNGGGR